jgi:uncharacterized protein (TIGR00369 family)
MPDAMTSPPTDAPARIDLSGFLKQAREGHTVALGLRYIDNGEDWCELALDYDRRLVSDATSGILASGPIVSLMDMATTMSIWAKRGGVLPHATLDLRIDYLRPARAGNAVFGRAECYRLTRRVAFVRGTAHDGDANDPVAHVAGTYMLLDK